MATFPATATAASNTSSSMGYHHLLAASNGNHDNSNSTSPNENIVQTSIITDTNTHTSFDTNTDFSFYLPSTQQTNLFDAAIPSSTSPSNFNNDPVVRHFFNYRQTDSNYNGNYYPNAYDYPYANITSSTPHFGTDAAVPNHGFTSVSNNQQQQHAYMPYHQQNNYPWMRRIHNNCGE
jgi:hypothetical protein